MNEPTAIPANKGRRYPPHPLTRQDCEQLLEHAGPRRAGVRNRAMLALMYRAGLRSGETCGLRMGYAFRWLTGGLVVRVEEPKGWRRRRKPAKPREWGLDTRTRDLVQEWLDLRGPAPGIVFCPLAHGGRFHFERRLSTQYVRMMVSRAARRAGIEGRAHPHGLRHTFACELYEETRDVLLVMRALGHSNLTTTQTYLEGLGVVSASQHGWGREW